MLSELISCPSCGDLIVLHDEIMPVTYKFRKYRINQYFYWCERCGEEYTTEESDYETLLQIPGWEEDMKNKT